MGWKPIKHKPINLSGIPAEDPAVVKERFRKKCERVPQGERKDNWYCRKVNMT